MTGANVPSWLNNAAAVSARLLIVAAAVAVVVFAIAQLTLVVFPLIAALFLTTVLDPIARRLTDAGLPPALSALTVLLGVIALLIGLVTVLAPQVADQVDQLDLNLEGGINTIRDWLTDGPLNLGEGEIADATNRVLDEIRQHSATLTEQAISGTVVVFEVIAGTLLALVLTFFFLKDGREIWAWLLGLANPQRRAEVGEMGERAWGTLGGYLRGLTVSAFIEAVLVAIILLVLGMPLVLPIAVLTFFGAFIPIVGAFVVGFLAALVALFSEGLGLALLVIAAYTGVQQLEANVLHPLIVGRSVELHPAAIVLAVTAGGVLAGIPGAFLAVPLVAVAAAVLGYLRDSSEDVAAPVSRVAG